MQCLFLGIQYDFNFKFLIYNSPVLGYSYLFQVIVRESLHEMQ